MTKLRLETKLTHAGLNVTGSKNTNDEVRGGIPQFIPYMVLAGIFHL